MLPRLPDPVLRHLPCPLQVKLQTVLSSEAYLLFYTRRRSAEGATNRGSSPSSPLPPRPAPSPAKGRSPFATATGGHPTPPPERTTPAQVTQTAPLSGARVNSTWTAPEGEGTTTQATGAKAADSGGAPVALVHGLSSRLAKLGEVPDVGSAPRGRKRAAGGADAVLGAVSGGSEASATGTGGRGAIAPETGARKRMRKGTKGGSLPDDEGRKGASRLGGSNGGFGTSNGEPSGALTGPACTGTPASRDGNPSGRARDGTIGEGSSRGEEERTAGLGKGMLSSPALSDSGAARPGRGGDGAAPDGTEARVCEAGTGDGRDDASTPRGSDERAEGEARKEVSRCFLEAWGLNKDRVRPWGSDATPRRVDLKPA